MITFKDFLSEEKKILTEFVHPDNWASHYLYWVIYPSAENPSEECLYTGIKEKNSAKNSQPWDNFFGSLRFDGTKNKVMKPAIWLKAIAQISNNRFQQGAESSYMTSAGKHSDKDSLGRAYERGVVGIKGNDPDPNCHPIIFSGATPGFVQERILGKNASKTKFIDIIITAAKKLLKLEDELKPFIPANFDSAEDTIAYAESGKYPYKALVVFDFDEYVDEVGKLKKYADSSNTKLQQKEVDLINHEYKDVDEHVEEFVDITFQAYETRYFEPIVKYFKKNNLKLPKEYSSDENFENYFYPILLENPHVFLPPAAEMKWTTDSTLQFGDKSQKISTAITPKSTHWERFVAFLLPKSIQPDSLRLKITNEILPTTSGRSIVRNNSTVFGIEDSKERINMHSDERIKNAYEDPAKNREFRKALLSWTQFSETTVRKYGLGPDKDDSFRYASIFNDAEGGRNLLKEAIQGEGKTKKEAIEKLKIIFIKKELKILLQKSSQNRVFKYGIKITENGKGFYIDKKLNKVPIEEIQKKIAESYSTQNAEAFLRNYFRKNLYTLEDFISLIGYEIKSSLTSGIRVSALPKILNGKKTLTDSFDSVIDEWQKVLVEGDVVPFRRKKPNLNKMKQWWIETADQVRGKTSKKSEPQEKKTKQVNSQQKPAIDFAKNILTGKRKFKAYFIEQNGVEEKISERKLIEILDSIIKPKKETNNKVLPFRQKKKEDNTEKKQRIAASVENEYKGDLLVEENHFKSFRQHLTEGGENDSKYKKFSLVQNRKQTEAENKIEKALKSVFDRIDRIIHGSRDPKRKKMFLELRGLLRGDQERNHEQIRKIAKQIVDYEKENQNLLAAGQAIDALDDMMKTKQAAKDALNKFKYGKIEIKRKNQDSDDNKKPILN